ncbi:NLR family CARD domain-containing protein 3-like [Anguilla anguilla]|uniref:NLR family CARD domain-containing protein 3-like n=1 Tax=Anguilla anguilla TaxID=7936 RepID=UPI0015AA9FBC|nr:NLR family CARD domain-containing protein 3-like [Anguilla anguilla]
MKSDHSMDPPINFRGQFTGDQRVREERTGSPVPSCLSMKSDHSMDPPINFRGQFTDDQRIHCSQVSNHIVERSSEKLFSKQLTSSPVKQKDLTDSLERDEQHNKSIERAQQALKTALKKKFEHTFEGLAKQANPTLLNEIYTELYITEGGSGGVNDEHEVRQIEIASKRQTTQETAILCNDIFKPLPGQEKPIRTVLTKGIAGIGKTVSVQKFILDWANGKANQDIDFIFTLPFRDLNLKKEREFSLMKLLQQYFPQLKEIKSFEDEVKIVFIFDGLDECRLPLDFQSNKICRDITESSSVDVLLTNLILGNLLPSALLWITSRPAAANQVPPECVHQVTEVQGFKDPQKEEYFRKRIRDEIKASRIISHVKSSRSLHIMCHIPVFCWISATVLETMLGKVGNRKMPKTLTEMYTHFLLIQTNVKNEKYPGTNETTSKKMSASNTEIILKLGQLALLQLERGNLIFYEEDLRESGIDVSEASVYSGVCTEIFKEECGLGEEKVYCFVHLSIQEYLAALFVFHSCVNENRNVLRAEQSKPCSDGVQLSELHRTAVDQALESKNGHLDLFLRFLLGLSLDSIQTLLGGILTKTGSRSPKTVQYIKKKIKEESSAERTINLFHCLNELNKNAPVEEIKKFQRSGKLSNEKLEPHQCSALAFMLLMSEEILDEFDLKTYNTSAAGYERLLPVVGNCRKAILNYCDLTEKSCEIVASALQSSNSPLRDLDLSNNNLGDTGVKLLCAGLMSPNCKLQTLGLGWCNITDGCCDVLASVLRSPHSELRDLELRDNDLQDSGVRALSAGLEDPHCKVQRLGLSGCRVTQRGCDSLASALCSNPSHLRELDLRYNHPGDSGVRALALSARLEDPHCKLQRLGVDHGGENRTKPGPRKYGCQFTLDPNTAHRQLSLSEGNRRVTHTLGREEQPYPDHPERFDYWCQVVCRESVCERCYWEAEFSVSERGGGVYIAVIDKGISRKGQDYDCMFGENKNSWCLGCFKFGPSGKLRYSVWHNENRTDIPAPPSPYRRAGVCDDDDDDGRGVCVYRVGVCVDRPAGTLSFYSVVLLMELTLPWGEGAEAAYERKRLKYSDLAAECESMQQLTTRLPAPAPEAPRAPPDPVQLYTHAALLPREPHIPAPERYAGDLGKCKTFLMQRSLDLQPDGTTLRSRGSSETGLSEALKDELAAGDDPDNLGALIALLAIKLDNRLPKSQCSSEEPTSRKRSVCGESGRDFASTVAQPVTYYPPVLFGVHSGQP